MQLSQQLCLLDQSKRLKELGVVQESLFYWASLIFPSEIANIEVVYEEMLSTEMHSYNKIASAFSVAELGVMLERKADYAYYVHNNWYSFGGYYPTEAQARAAYVTHLLETGQLTVEEVNRRLVK